MTTHLPRLGFALLALHLAACGDDGGTIIDAATPDTAVAIDAAVICRIARPVGQQGCGAGQRCTWIDIGAVPSTLGKFECRADGTLAAGDACTVGPPGETTGIDQCPAGTYCVGAVCRDMCEINGTGIDGCGAAETCTFTTAFGSPSPDPPLGTCGPASL